MSHIKREGDREIEAFGEALTQALGHGEWPPTVAGDLSDLLGTLEQGVELLRDLMRASCREEIPAKLLGVELLLADDLARFATDLLPFLRDLCKEAYAALGDEEALADDEPLPR